MGATLLFAAAILIFGVGVTHSWLGESKLIGPLTAAGTRSGLLAHSGLARLVLRFAWHITSIAWWGLAAILIVLARQPLDASGKLVLLVIAATFLATGLACSGGGRRHWAWLIFLMIGGLTLGAAL